MDSLSVFLEMGGYAAYVWPAFGVCAVVMTWLATSSYRALVREKRTLESLEPMHARAEQGDEASSPGRTR